jgi:hypothetical protein
MKTGIIILAVGGAAAAALYIFDKGSLNQAVADIVPSPTDALAKAIATAEGFYSDGSRPQRNHNPGDMTLDIIGKGIGKDGPFIVYANDADGWANLKAQIQEWFDGTSRNADNTATIADLSQFYTDTEKSSWANNVANALGVSIDTPISDISGG